MKPSPNQSRQSRQVVIQKWLKLLVRKIIKNFIEENDKLGFLDILKLPEATFERFFRQINLKNRVEIISLFFCI